MTDTTNSSDIHQTDFRERRHVSMLFWGMIVRPRDTLTYIRDSAGSTWLWPAVTAALVLVVSLILITPITRAEAEAQLESMQEQFAEGLSPEEQAQMEQVTDLTSGPLFTVVIPSATGVIGLTVGWLLRGGVLYLLSLMLGGQAQFPPIFRMAVWTTLPDILHRLVGTVGTLIAGRILTSGLSFLAPAPAPGIPPPVSTALLGAFLGRLDLYLVWGLALTMLGVIVTARLSWRKGALVTLIYLILSLGATLIPVWVGSVIAAQTVFAPTG